MPTRKTGRAALRAAPLALVVLAGGSTAACEDEEPSVPLGTLVQSWTIDGLTDVTRCPFYDAELMRVVVIDSSGVVSATELGACNFFRVRVVVPPGRYTGTATFLNGAREPVSETRALPEFDILEDGVTSVTIDFSGEDFADPTIP